ncbi:MAG: acetylornithine/succinylornithine family transaminase [Clostridiales bacterium]|nr:acetylornithine/succinylornithine family transaminase [Clostridiales bacterium]
MENNGIFADDGEYIANTYARYKVAFKSGKGALLYDFDGKEYIDCATGIGVNIFGINDEEWKSAVKAQLDSVQHVCNLYYSLPQTELAKLLCKKTGAKKVFFGNSGAEANECAIKVARKYGNERYGRNEIITLRDSFHGRTIATLTATGQDGFHKFFSPFLEGFKYAEPTMDGIFKCYTDKTCAVMVEVIQGESGVNVIDFGFLKELERFCKERDILLICDEVQCGNGRTGYLYAYEAAGIHPDIVTTAKGLGGGLPIGVCMLFDKCENVFGYGDHGTTFGGNPVVCAGAANIVERLTPELLLEVQGKGAYLKSHLEHIKNVTNVSGMGLMIGISTTKNAREVAQKCLEKGLVVLTAHDKVRLLPPLIISKEQINSALKILDEVISQ